MFVRHVCLIVSVLIAAALLPSSPAQAQAAQDFLAQAIPLARQSQRETGVPASVTLAQAMWETGRGTSPIGMANNYFGIKAGGTTDGDVNVGPIASGWVWAWTREWNGTRYVERRERFRQYRSMADSFRDHGILLATAPRYADAMRAVDDPREFARRIAAAGYATSPTYADDLTALMDAENLYQYDLPRNDAQFLGQSDYLTLKPGDIFQIYFDVKNTGFGTWSPTADYYLASTNGAHWGTSARQPLTELVLPEGSTRWAITLLAPRAPGTYRTAWQLHHGARTFGPEMYIVVEVREAQAVALWQIGIVGGIAVLLAGGGAWLWRRQQQRDRARFV